MPVHSVRAKRLQPATKGTDYLAGVELSEETGLTQPAFLRPVDLHDDAVLDHDIHRTELQPPQPSRIWAISRSRESSTTGSAGHLR